MSNATSEQSDLPLVVKLNRVIEAHYPPGSVDYVEAIRGAMAIATAYQRALEGNSPAHANMIRHSAEKIAEWMSANPS